MAQYNLGRCYYNGQGVDIDYPKAIRWFSAAALQGLKEAQYSLGVCYYNGDGVEQDNDKAAYWILKAADQGHKKAQELLEKWEKEK